MYLKVCGVCGKVGAPSISVNKINIFLKTQLPQLPVVNRGICGNRMKSQVEAVGDLLLLPVDLHILSGFRNDRFLDIFEYVLAHSI